MQTLLRTVMRTHTGFSSRCLKTALKTLPAMARLKTWRDPEVKNRLRQRDMTALISVRDIGLKILLCCRGGTVTASESQGEKTEIEIIFNDAATVWQLVFARNDHLTILNAMKNFRVEVRGADEKVIWFIQTLSHLAGLQKEVEYGTKMGGGVVRYVNNTNGGPVFVYVRNGKIVRITPIEFDDRDGRSWTITARGRSFTPPRRGTVNPYVFGLRSLIYSKDRLLYPMKRVDFDPRGDRNPQNRGISSYERVSWDEALDIVAAEIKRVKREHGPGAILNSCGSHHTWGNIGYWLSAKTRFMNSIGSSQVVHNPDSWEGWYWGAVHHWGNSIRNGASDTYGTVEDCLKEAEMIVFWSSDPESTSGVYGAFEGTVRRQWAKSLGIRMVHIDPFYNHTAALLGGKWIAPRPDTGNAMALAIAWVWITEDLYDKEYVAERTTGFAKWRDYVLGVTDGTAKTPEWQEPETGVPGRVVRSLARQWGSRKTYLSPGGLAGFGGACRCATGIEWARSMVCLMAMQGLGKPGVNLGCLQQGAPVDTHFYFPGYAEGGLSGDLDNTGLRVSMYQRMVQLPSMNPVSQLVPRMRIPEAILGEEITGYPTDPKSIEGQFRKFGYPAPGHSPIRLYYKYGGSHFGTMGDSNRYVRAYRSERLEFVVNQSIWFEGEAKFADILLPACTNFERWDIGETANSGGYSHHQFIQWNHRIVTMQHKCIEPLGESRSDYQIFLDLANRLGLGNLFSEAMTELDWCRRLFDASDLPTRVSWKDFVKKGYYVVPAPAEQNRAPVSWRWFAEGREKDVPELAPLPADYAEKWRKGLQTQSGKLEFESSSLKRFDPDDPERPPLPSYIPSWEGHHVKELYEKYPLNLVSPHPRYSFHTMFDGKDSIINDVREHRTLIDGYYYWIVRINSVDARERGIADNTLVRMYNDRGAVILAAQVTDRVPPKTVISAEGSAVYDPVGEPGHSADRGGCVNLLTSSRNIISRSHSTPSNSCLVQIQPWSSGDVS
ncbi:molybdopterin-dependent oxidoreductase [Desulforhopalus singaporensis]|uniref:Trimethylamine-N-oxide reductase (Cytochrome c) n=1 Tax=Desulforhopalus singaporensis TaxID=91360 RepID=A0A1H0IUQ6_9BACT|nr:molybdopterin-dependent oxidoreductase [Desulforhopalus singaporensis]SDO35236.1 trimethylamine-N-oxide reductase (cytochrome c) [Desulforhopalus singaporensis]